jgi:hypothetical protein
VTSGRLPTPEEIAAALNDAEQADRQQASGFEPDEEEPEEDEPSPAQPEPVNVKSAQKGKK